MKNEKSFGFIAPKTLNYLAFQSFDFERIPDEGYSRMFCALNLIATLLSHRFHVHFILICVSAKGRHGRINFRCG
jgi:hypothetical protein